jgi:hypothetical protein
VPSALSDGSQTTSLLPATIFTFSVSMILGTCFSDTSFSAVASTSARSSPHNASSCANPCQLSIPCTCPTQFLKTIQVCADKVPGPNACESVVHCKNRSFNPHRAEDENHYDGDHHLFQVRVDVDELRDSSFDGLGHVRQLRSQLVLGASEVQSLSPRLARRLPRQFVRRHTVE